MMRLALGLAAALVACSPRGTPGGSADAGSTDGRTSDGRTSDGPTKDGATERDATATPDGPGATLDAPTSIPDAGSTPTIDAAPAPIDASNADAYMLTAEEQAACDTLVKDMNSEITAADIPGASFAVVLHGHLACTGVAGVRDVASGAPVTTSTRFRADSMSKMVLAATAMSLVRDGLLDLQAPITDYLPWFALSSGFDASTIDTEQLLTHTSGFPCDTISECSNSATIGPRETFFKNYPQPLWSPPGAVFDYSNVGFTLASQVLVAAAGLKDTDFEQLVHDRVFVPAGMTTATYDAASAAQGESATDYLLNASGGVITHRSVAWGDCPMLHPSGGVIATPTDYAHFAEKLLADGGAFLDPADVAAMEAAHVSLHARPSESYGYGLVHELSPYPTHASIWHDGELPGSYNITYLVPDRQFAVVIMVNATGGPRPPAAANVVSDALILFIPDARTVPSGATDPATWGKYAGTYDDSYGTLGSGVVISLASGKLSVNAPNSTTAGSPTPVQGVMVQIATDQFQLPDGTAATFFPDAGGVFRYLVTRRGTATR